MLCSACGKQLDDGAVFCFNCGAAVEQKSRPPARKGMHPLLIVLIVLGGLALLIVPIMIAVAVPKLAAARAQASELSAIQYVRTINTAEVQYYAQFGHYAGSLVELATPPADLIPADLASGTKAG